jgi:hypothetical protein
VTTLIACPVCFGASDAPMAVATNLGIFVMLGVVAVVLACFGAFIFYLNRRAKLVAAEGNPAVRPAHGRPEQSRRATEAGSHGTGAGSHIDLEGTARC